MNEVPLIGRGVHVIGFTRVTGPQMWTGDFTIVPGAPLPPQPDPKNPGQFLPVEIPRISVPNWTFVFERALRFPSGDMAARAIKTYDQYFGWIKDIEVIMLKSSTNGTGVRFRG